MAKTQKEALEKKKKTDEVEEVKKTAKKVENPSTDAKKKPVGATTKAGKHSKKAIAEAEEKAKKEERKKKASNKEIEDKPKVVQKPRVKWYSKNQKSARELIDSEKLYTIADAIALLPKISKVKFDPTAEVHISLELDTKQADQNLRTSAVLPAGTGKNVRVAVITSDKEAEAAKKAGADNVDAEVILSEISKGKLDFDVLVASPDKMGELGKHAKILGPKGLMPSPKSGTVTPTPSVVVEEIKKGRAEIKNDANGIVHVAFGKLSFKPKDLETNLEAVIKAVKSNRPTGVKGTYIKSIYVTSSMSPSIKLDIAEALK
jgi:large subunit ribosomal protein L1